MHPFQAIRSGPDPGYVSSALRSRREGQRYVFQPGGIRTKDHYLLMGRDYVNLHSRKRLEGVLQELSGIIADLQDV